MKHSDYEIGLCQVDQISDVAGLLGETLWAKHDVSHASYFRWKYHLNPYAIQPMGVIAVHDGSIVAFRGYFATAWYVDSLDDTTAVLVPGDTVVRSDHRRNGLSIAMGNLAMERFASSYRILLSTSAGKTSIPGYLRMGFVPLRNKSYYQKSSLVRDIKVILRGALGQREVTGDLPIDGARISFGDFGTIKVSKDPRPQDMARVISGDHQQAPRRISLLQDEAFFRWRFANPKGRYVFYFSKSAGVIQGYLVMMVSGDSEQGFIVDYGQTSQGHIGRILDHIAGRKEFDEVNLLNINRDEPLWDTLKTRRFRRWGLHGFVKTWVYGNRPLLVRPTKPNCAEADWFLSGLDIRDMDSWHFKHICQDDA